MPADKFLVKFRRLLGENAGHDVDAALAQPLKPLSRDKRVRILDRGNDALYPGVDQRLGTRRRFAVVGMRLKRNVCGPATRILARLRKCQHLGMGDIFLNIGPLADSLAILRFDHATDKRIRTDKSGTFSREKKR